MTSLRQIVANQRNAVRSTGPSTEEGKRRSRGNAVRMDCVRKPLSKLSRMSRTTGPSKPQSSPTTRPRPRSSASWCLGWHRCYGVCVVQLRSRPICFGSQRRYYKTVAIRRVNPSANKLFPFELSKPELRLETPRVIGRTMIPGAPTIKPSIHHGTCCIAFSGSPSLTMACFAPTQ